MDIPLILDKKTSVAVLAPHYTALLKGYAVPCYEIKLRKSRTVSDEVKYRSLVKACNIQTVGYGSTEEIAKTNSAMKALELLDDFEDCWRKFPRRVKSYDEELHDFATARHDTLPVYELVPDIDTDAPFVYNCHYLTYDVRGYGATEDKAKKHAARRITELMFSKGVMPYSSMMSS